MNLPDRAFGAGVFYPQRKVHADLSEGAPDGAEIDTHGKLRVACENALKEIDKIGEMLFGY